MEQLTLLPILTATLLIAALYQFYILFKNYRFIKKSNTNSYHNNEFAFNSIHNNSRNSGLSNNKVLGQCKISQGGSDYSDDILENTINKKDSIILKFDVKERDSYIFVPQVKLNGAAWFT